MFVGLRLGIVLIGALAAAQAVAAAHLAANAAPFASFIQVASLAVLRPANWGMLLLGFAAIGVARRVDVRKLARVTV